MSKQKSTYKTRYEQVVYPSQKSKPFDPFELDLSPDNSIPVTSTIKKIQKENRHNLITGIIIGATAVILIMLTATVAIKAILPAPDLTMTPEQYQEYIYSCTSQ